MKFRTTLTVKHIRFDCEGDQRLATSLFRTLRVIEAEGLLRVRWHTTEPSTVLVWAPERLVEPIRFTYQQLLVGRIAQVLGRADDDSLDGEIKFDPSSWIQKV